MLQYNLGSSASEIEVGQCDISCAPAEGIDRDGKQKKSILKEDKNVTSARTSKKREKTIKSVLIDNLMICYFPYLCFNRDILKRVSFNLIRTSRHIPVEGVSSPCSLLRGTRSSGVVLKCQDY